MVNHKYSTMTLYIFIILLVLGFAVAELGTDDLDEVCSTDEALLKRIGGSWQCSTTNFAETYYHNYTTPFAVNISQIDTYYRFNATTLSALRGFTQNSSGLVTQKTAVYKATGVISFSGGNSGIYEVEMHVNNIPEPKCSFFRTLSSNDIGVGVFTCIIQLNVGDLINVKVKDIDAPPQNIEFQQFNLNIVEVQ